MKVLAEEWKKRDTEREVVTKKKLQEYARLEEQLRRKLTDLEKRERSLAANEQEVTRLRADLEREHERKMTEMREASRRMREDFEHQVNLEKYTQSLKSRGVFMTDVKHAVFFCFAEQRRKSWKRTWHASKCS